MTNSIQSIGLDNQPIIDAITKARKVAVDLCHQGFRVLDISINSRTRTPRIIINPSPKCKRLESPDTPLNPTLRPPKK